MKKLFILFFFILPFASLESQQDNIKRYDIVHYDLFLNINMDSGTLSGINNVRFFTDTILNSIVLHSKGLIIDKVICNGDLLRFELDNHKEHLKIYNNFKSKDTNNVIIYYHYDNKYKRSPNRKGFYYFKKNDYIIENIAYTMSEPNDARCWYPCWDEPNDKFLADLHIRVSNVYTVASNGILVNEYNDSDTSKVFHWKVVNPISSYLVSFAISKYSQFSHYYHKLTNPQDSIEIKYYFWKPDSNGFIYNAVRSFKNVPKMIEVLSRIFGEYPFEKYGMAVVYPFNYGGEEHQTISTIHRDWLYYGEEIGILHELSHQWWGDLVTCKTWKDIWLNESFATYSEYLWLEKINSNKDALLSKLFSYETFNKDWEKAIYDPEGQGIELFSDIVYKKGALVLHTLRNIIGDSIFFNCLKEYREKFEYSYAETKDFIEIVNKCTNKDYQWFFDLYIYSKGYPKVKFYYIYNKKKLDIVIEQLKFNSHKYYNLPLEVQVNSNIKTVYINNKNEKIVISFDSIDFPFNIVLNPNKKIFVKIQE